MWQNICSIIDDWYVCWLVVGFVTGIIDLFHYYRTKGNITSKHILDLIFFMCMGIIGTIMFLKIHGDEIVLIKKKEKK